tara:strand:+ start:2012 stop:2575 length:564 start_codon:yes stop_codon:yes gene_type:complete
MYLNDSGVHIGKIASNITHIDKSLKFAKIIEMTLQKKTYLTYPSYDFRSPSDAIEKRSIARRYETPVPLAVIKLHYRMKFFERLVKMYKRGFEVLNSPLRIYTWSNSEISNLSFSNNEKYCCISHEEFKEKDIVIKLTESKAVMKENVFYDYITQTPVDTPRYEALISGDWALTCPVSGRLTKSFFL